MGTCIKPAQPKIYTIRKIEDGGNFGYGVSVKKGNNYQAILLLITATERGLIVALHRDRTCSKIEIPAKAYTTPKGAYENLGSQSSKLQYSFMEFS